MKKTKTEIPFYFSFFGNPILEDLNEKEKFLINDHSFRYEAFYFGNINSEVAEGGRDA